MSTSRSPVGRGAVRSPFIRRAAKGLVWCGVCKPFDGELASAGNDSMVGFIVKSTAEVDAFHAKAMSHGRTDEGGPNPRPHYGPDWYSAYVRDTAGNRLSVVYNG